MKINLKVILNYMALDIKADEPFKFVLKWVDKKHKAIDYLVTGNKTEITIEDIYLKL